MSRNNTETYCRYRNPSRQIACVSALAESRYHRATVAEAGPHRALTAVTARRARRAGGARGGGGASRDTRATDSAGPGHCRRRGRAHPAPPPPPPSPARPARPRGARTAQRSRARPMPNDLERARRRTNSRRFLHLHCCDIEIQFSIERPSTWRREPRMSSGIVFRFRI